MQAGIYAEKGFRYVFISFNSTKNKFTNKEKQIKKNKAKTW